MRPVRLGDVSLFEGTRKGVAVRPAATAGDSAEPGSETTDEAGAVESVGSAAFEFALFCTSRTELVSTGAIATGVGLGGGVFWQEGLAFMCGSLRMKSLAAGSRSREGSWGVSGEHRW
jgi:hypothetical protein